MIPSRLCSSSKLFRTSFKAFCESLSTNLSGTKKKYYQIKNTKGSNVPVLQKHLLLLSILAPVNHRHKSAIWYEILCLSLKISMWCLTCQQFSLGDKHIVNSKITFQKTTFRLLLQWWEEIMGLIYPQWSCDIKRDFVWNCVWALKTTTLRRTARLNVWTCAYVQHMCVIT